MLLAVGLAVGGGAGAERAKAGGLSAAEKKAMKVTSISASTSAKAGLLVDVGFGGNMEQRLGRGGLKDGVVAVILHPETAGSPTQYILTQGAGVIGETLT